LCASATFPYQPGTAFSHILRITLFLFHWRIPFWVFAFLKFSWFFFLGFDARSIQHMGVILVFVLIWSDFPALVLVSVPESSTICFALLRRAHFIGVSLSFFGVAIFGQNYSVHGCVPFISF
jgi:hypothetical protein